MIPKHIPAPMSQIRREVFGVRPLPPSKGELVVYRPRLSRVVWAFRAAAVLSYAVLAYIIVGSLLR